MSINPAKYYAVFYREPGQQWSTYYFGDRLPYADGRRALAVALKARRDYKTRWSRAEVKMREVASPTPSAVEEAKERLIDMYPAGKR